MFLQNGYKGKNDWYVYFIGILVIMSFYFIGQLPLTGFIFYKMASEKKISEEKLADFQNSMDFSAIGMSSNTGFILMILIFFFAMAGLILSLKIHHKKLVDLVNTTGRVRLSRIFVGFAVWFFIGAIFEAASYYLSPASYTFTFEWQKFIPLLLISILMLPVQTSFEELFFRGYIMQGMAAGSRKLWPALIVSSLLFALMHSANPEIGKFGYLPMMTYYFVAGLFLALVTIFDDGLELALGIHAATNIYGATILTYAGSVLQTDTVFKVQTIDPWMMLGVFVLSAVISMVLFHRLYGWNMTNSLHQKMDPSIF